MTLPAALLALAIQPLLESSVPALATPVAIAAKGDRLVSAPHTAEPRARAASVEIVGVDAARVIVREASGAVLFQADAARNTTVAARNAELPAVTVRTAEGAKAENAPVAPPPVEPAVRPRMRVGCEGSVSALAGQEARRLLPSRCLAALDSGISHLAML